MGKYLVTGRSGTGKSTICHELQRRGLSAFDGDKVDGLADWIDAVSGKRIQVDYTQPIDRKTRLWHWDQTVLQNLLTAHTDIFLCGSADNDLEFHTYFDKIFALTLPPETQRQRILTRTEHGYGKQPGMLDRIVAEQRSFCQKALRHGATMIDANRPINEIVDEILGLAHDNQRMA